MKNNEALRCLLCKKPRCTEGCPVGTGIPACIALYRQDRLEEAGEILFRNNPLSVITSQVCDWKQFCYGHCVLNVKKIPVRWYEIESEISEKWIFSHKLEVIGNRAKGRSIALVGGGPASIAAAIWLHAEGAKVTIFEARDRLGGVLRYGIPSFRLDKKYVDVYERLFKEAGIDVRCGVKVGTDIDMKVLSQEYDAVMVAAGAEKPATLGIEGEQFPHVIQALSFLENPQSFNLGRKVIVIGGGNVAMDACRTAAKMGVETWVYYRKTFENMPANPLEVEFAQRDGVRFEMFEAPVRVRLHSVIFRQCENVTDPETGQVLTKIIDGTDHEVSCDTLITAISEKPDFSILKNLYPNYNKYNYPVTDEAGLVDCAGGNVYIAGDYILGPATIVQAVSSARKSVDAIISSFER